MDRTDTRTRSMSRAKMQRKFMQLAATAGLLVAISGGTMVRAGAPLRVSDHGDLQAAIDAAFPGETVLVDIDTPGAVLDKKLTIKGFPGEGAGGVIHSDVVFPSVLNAALVLFPGASGSEILDVRMDGPTGIASLGTTVDHVTVRGCRITAADAAIYLDAGGSTGWNIEHNTIRIEHKADFQQIFKSGIYLRFQSETRISHNEISGQLIKGTFSSATSGGVVILGGDGIQVTHNRIDVNTAGGPPIPWTIEAVIIQATSAGVEGLTVAMNDFSRSLSSYGPHGVTYVGTLDDASDVTGLGSFDHFPNASPAAIGLAIVGNLSAGTGNRGADLSLSDLSVRDLMAP